MCNPPLFSSRPRAITMQVSAAALPPLPAAFAASVAALPPTSQRSNSDEEAVAIVVGLIRCPPPLFRHGGRGQKVGQEAEKVCQETKGR
jgi:hypothetical protein